jgi:COP9 signalosome complex subunit 3
LESTTASGKAAPRQLSAALLPEGALWPHITQFLLTFDTIQVRYCGELLLKVIDVVVKGAEQTQNLVPAIQLLHNIILRLDSTSSTYTSTHYYYVRLCLLTRAYAEAVDILDRPIYHIPANLDKQTEARSYKFRCSPQVSGALYLTPTTGLTHKVTVRDYLQYYLMGAICYLGNESYDKAKAFLEIVISAPTQQNVASMIMVEAYKKWVLVSLLVNGSASDLPRSTSTSALRHMRNLAKPYDCVVEAFKNSDRSRLQAEIEQGMEIWNEDMNYGLIFEVYNAHRRHAVTRLAKTFTAVPISYVAKQTSTEPENVDETLVYLQNLIATGNLNATTTPSSSTPNSNDLILRFLSDSSSQRSEEEVELQLSEKNRELQILLKHIVDIEHRTEISREYIDFLRKLKKTRDDERKDLDKSGNSGPQGAGGPFGKGSGKQSMAIDEIDEDMMDEF